MLTYIACIFLLVASQFYSNCANAIAWLPDDGQYKFSSSVFFTDHYTKKLQENKLKLLAELDRDVHFMLQCDDLTQEEKKELKKMLAECQNLDILNDNFFVTNELEYGLGPEQSFGLKVSYAFERALRYGHKSRHLMDNIPSGIYNKTTKAAGFYYKHLLYKNDHWRIAARPELHYFGIKQLGAGITAGLGIYGGYSGTTKSGKSHFSEVGVSISRDFNEEYYDITSYKLGFAEGIEMFQGWVISNYLEYTFTNDRNILYKHLLYEQLSLTKEFASITKRPKYSAQVGYYWKKSLSNSKYLRVSGPMLSLHVTL